MKYNSEIAETWKDNEGRILGLQVKTDTMSFHVVNIYAPTKDKLTDQMKFINTLESHFNLAEEPYILGGDFNTYMNPTLDKHGGIIEHNTQYSIKIQNLMDEYNIVDIWRLLNPNTKHYTWRQKQPKIQSRLDYFLISGELVYNIKHTKIKPAIRTDHSLLEIKVTLINEQKRGPGFWKFNCGLVRDETYINLIRNKINQLKEQYEQEENHGLKWDLIKCELRQLTITYSKQLAKSKRQHENSLQNQFRHAAEQLRHNNTERNQTEYDRIKMEIEHLNSIKTQGAHIRCKALQVEENERSTKFFLNVEKRNYKMKHIQKLHTADNNILYDPKAILEEQKMFYKKLYTKNVHAKKNLKHSFLNNDKLQKLSEELKVSM